jgi:DNA-binding beta-propeller fold protein YncE
MIIDAFLSLHQTIQAATEGEYRFVAKWGPPGNVQNPTGIAVDTAGLVYVADMGEQSRTVIYLLPVTSFQNGVHREAVMDNSVHRRE